jgi:preprotein translocase subunit SecD
MRNSKSTIAIIAAVAAVACWAAAIVLQGHPLAILGGCVATIGTFVYGLAPGPRKNALVVMAIAVGTGGLFFHYDSFWGLVISGLSFVWAAFGLLPFVDNAWRMKLGFVAAVFLGALVTLWPTLNNMSGGKIPLPAYVRDRVTFAIAPGLDLKGGIRLVYTVEVEEAIRDKRDHIADEMRQELATAFGFHSGEGRVTREELNKLDEKVHVGQPETALIRLRFKDKADQAKIDDRFSKKFLGELSQSKGPGENELTFKLRSDVESQIRDGAVAQAKDTVNRRVDELGLKEPSVTTRDEDIIVEVPGTDERSFNDIKDTIRKTARLEFKMVDDPGAGKIFGPPALKAEDLPDGEGIAQYSEVAPNGLKPGGGRDNVSTYYVRMNCQPPKYPKETMNECLARFKEWTKTLNVPDDHVVGFEAITEPIEDTSPLQFKEVGWRTFYLYARAEVTGDYITDARKIQDTQNFGAFQVQMSFSPAGADRFEEVTGANINRRFAIILDDRVTSAPYIKQKISGNAVITLGAGDQEKQLHEANQLELVLKSGALPAPITPSTESLIGPSLGKDAIQQGVKGAFYGTLAVLAFMILYYRKSGVVADVAVLFNLMLQMAVLAMAGASMTLPGIAGLALTIGMSVDANVLINERIREELRGGKSVRAAVDQGYSRALPAIIDGHATVLICALILAQYGSGPVKGFAITLFIGILCSFFTGYFCTRIVFDWWVRGARVKRLSVGAEF